MVSGTLAPLYSFWVKVGLKRGSGPDRGQSPVEWGDFPFVHPSAHTYVRWAGSYINFIFLSLQNRTMFHILHKKLIP